MQTAEVVKDTVTPGDKWAFDSSVASCFDDMLSRSIPQYDVMRDAVLTLGRQYVQPKTDILDLGCSHGAALAPFVQEFGAYNRFIGLEVSPPMLDAARARFEGYTKTGVVDIRETDLRAAYPAVSASLTLSVLTLQFIPIEYRQRIVRDVFKHTKPGGAFILVEKVLGATSELNEIEVSRYYDLKRQHGYTQEQIDRKRLSLEGVLVPITAAWNEDLLSRAGFYHVDCFWRWMNFAGWLAVKE